MRLLPLFIVTSFIVVKATSIRSFQSKCLILASGTLAAPYLWLYDFILLMPYLICVFHEDITKVKYQDPLSLLLLIGLISVNFIGLLARDAIVDAIIPITALLICFLRLRLKNYRSSS